MRKIAAASLTVAALAVTAITFAPTSFGANPGLPQISGSQAKAEDSAEKAEIAGMADASWHRPPADASINKFVVALASAH